MDRVCGICGARLTEEGLCVYCQTVEKKLDRPDSKGDSVEVKA